ncbi:MAG: hypothetical protein FWB91_01315 [Defluviitaleaceae bacterium]|nr:hypothetical protein [Defluviitaleaceae bacterium]
MKQAKKIIAFWLSIIMLMGMMPAVVFAAEDDPPNALPPRNERPWGQRPVSDPTLMFGGSSGPVQSRTYNFSISWSRPPLSTVTVPDGGLSYAEMNLVAGDSYGSWTLFPTRYDVRFRNATIGEAPGASIPVRQIPTNDQQRRPQMWDLRESTGNMSLNLRHSSLYEINIEPIRHNPMLTILPPPAVPPGNRHIGTERAPVDNSPGGGPPGRDMIFLTDIALTGEGSGNTITITWEDPAWGGVSVFPYWFISYARYEAGQQIMGQNGRTFPVSSDAGPNEIQRNPDGTLTFTIIDPALRPIGTYAVSVEPMLGPNPANAAHRIRTRPEPGQPAPPPQREFTHDGRLFNLAFSPPALVEYRTEVMMVPALNIDQVGADFIRLWWSHLGGLIGGHPPPPFYVRHVVVEEWPPGPPEGPPPSTEDVSIRIGELATIGGPGFLTGINEWFIGPGIPRMRRGFALALHLSNGQVLRTNIVVYDPLLVEFSPYRPEIVEITHEGDGVLSLEWLAFARYPAVPEENELADPEFGGRFVDTALEYEIFISDCWETLTLLTTPLIVRDPVRLLTSRRLNPVQPEPATPQHDPTWRLYPFDYIRYFQTITQYGIESLPIQGNRVYFVRMRARRVPGDQTSSWAYGSVYVPPLEGLQIRPEMISAPPVEVVHANITDTSIPLRWDIRYLEIMQPNPQADWAPNRDVWHTVVGVDRSTPPRLIFGRSAAHINHVVGDSAVAPGMDPRHGFLNDIINYPPGVSTNLRSRLLGLGPAPLNVNMNVPRSVGDFLTEVRQEGGPLRDFLVLQHGYSPLSFIASPPALRIQDMTGYSYMVHVVPFADLMMTPLRTADDTPFEAYRYLIINNPTLWHSIGSPEPVNGVINHTVEGLEPNVPYVIFIRPYVTIGGNVIAAWYPTFVIGTTVEDAYRPIPDPTTPVLIEVPRYTTRNRVAVRWRVQADMVYEIRISHLFTDFRPTGFHPGGTVIPITWEHIQAARDGETVELEDPRALLDIQYVNEVPYFHLRISERFPFTVYYLWAYAFGVDDSGTIATDPSEPSNLVDIRTLDIEPPLPPRSLARAPQNLLNMYNRYNEAEYRSDEPHALNISFMRIFADLMDDMGQSTPRAEDGTATGGTARPLNLPNVPDTEAYAALHIIRFEELIANRRYYVRARTILTVRRSEEDVYSYEVQIADNEDFLDAITFVIPTLPAMDPINTRRAYSIWVSIEVDTGPDDGEYDAVHRPDQFPLPERDFEITYDPATQTLQWRFRTNQTGADGRPDQNVDQRFISRLVSERTFVYTMDLSQYHINRAAPISNRNVIIPLSIIRAFNERGITLEINAGDLVYRIPPGAFDTSETRSLQPGIGSYFHITMNTNPSGMPALAANTSHAIPPQRFGVQAQTPQRTVNLTTFAHPVDIILPMDNHITPIGGTAALFQSGAGVQGWQDMNGSFSFAENNLRAQVSRPGTFSGVNRHAPPTVDPGAGGTGQGNVAAAPTNPALARVTSRLTITDLHVFDAHQTVTTGMFNNIIHAVSHRNTTATMGGNLTSAQIQALQRSNLLAPGNLNRETAIDILVRLYGLQTNQRLTPMTPEASIPGITAASPEFRRNIRIAADIGFISGSLNPQGNLTMGDLMHMLDILMTDAGW